MKKSIIIVTIALLFSMNSYAQEQPVQKKKKAKIEKSCSTEEKKSCSTDEKKACGVESKSEKKGGCCAAKKTTETKS